MFPRGPKLVRGPKTPKNDTKPPILVLIRLVVTELCCHKIHMNTRENHIIWCILKVRVYY